MRPKKLGHRLSEPHILFPLLTMVLLVVIWSAAYELIRTRHQSALQQAQETARDMAVTYHAQLLRTLREIELSISMVAYVQEGQPAGTAVNVLVDRGMLPSAMLFSVSIYDGLGQLLASNSAGATTLSGPVLEAIIASNPEDHLWISTAQFDEHAHRWSLIFVRSLSQTIQSSPLIITVTIDAEFFVSSYEATRLGEQGMLALIDDNGRVLVRRSGDTIDIDGPLITDDVPASLLAGDGHLVEFAHPFDNINRFYTTQRLFGFPLTLVTGVSVDEQMADATIISLQCCF
ncbi:hypothetical protein E3V39_13470 [Gammaproteobacteria bacterium LSUCC0112]|nr:hypothetical protein E3V39_13470 [Gammaproteobacteria bacterium LSUCC0112]